MKKQKTEQKLIMVVDDDRDIRDSVKEILENEGYNVVTAVNGDDCLEQLKKLELKKLKPSLILMDIMMPGTPVSIIINRIKKIKICYLSVVKLIEAEKEDLMKSKNVVDFIQKPFDIDDLIKRVKKLVA